ncbi:VCBS repeat-containing protein [bacterium]|nr:VCBS repeat-containing protein [bacterium]
MQKSLSLALLIFLLAGCGGGGGGSSSNSGGGATNNSGAGGLAPSNFMTGKIVVTSILLRGIPATIDSLVFRAFDARGNQVYGPTQLPKAARTVLDGVPTSAVRLEIDYLEGSIVRGHGSHAVTVSAGQETEVVDPPFTDVTYALTGLRSLISRIDLDRGQTQTLNVVGTYADGTEQDVTSAVQWSSSDEAVAQVEAGGLLRARAVGTATLTARLDAFSQSVALEVHPPKLVSLQVTPEQATQLEGGQVSYHLLAQLADNTSQEVTAESWSSSNSSVATINSSGLASARTPGNTTIEANYQNRTGTTALTVAVNETLTNLQISPDNLQLPKGVNYQYSVNASYANGTVLDLTGLAQVTSDDNNIAQPGGLPPVAYESDGIILVPPPWFPGYSSLIAGTGLGTTHLTASYQGLTARASLTGIAAVPLRARVLPRGTTTLQAAGTLQLSTLTTLTDGTTQTNRADVSIPSTAHVNVDTNLLATAVSSGVDFLMANFTPFVTPPVAGGYASYAFRQGNPPDYNGLAVEPTVAVVSRDLGLNLTVGPGNSGLGINQFPREGNPDPFRLTGAQSGGNTLRVRGSGVTLARTRGLTSVGVGNFSGLSGRTEVFYAGVRTNSSGSDYGVVLSTTGSLQLAEFSDEPQGVSQAVVGDFDGNGRSDVAYLAQGKVKVRLSVGGVLDQSSTLVSSGATGLGRGDIDGDGRTDLIVASSNSLQVFRNLTPLSSVSLPPGQYGTDHMTCGDVDGDGRQDLCYISNRQDGNRYWTLFFGSAGGALVNPQQGTTGHRVQAIDLGDLNGDGKADLVTIESSSRLTLLGLTTRDCLLSVFPGSSQGFGSPQVLTLSTNDSPCDVSVLTNGGTFQAVVVAMVNTRFVGSGSFPIVHLTR